MEVCKKYLIVNRTETLKNSRAAETATAKAWIETWHILCILGVQFGPEYKS
ncbi:hypothetical protein L0128_14510 [candidate division KSB1 bacterium]|nr:hypothetical protein [candidate division KSB1 bacterium]